MEVIIELLTKEQLYGLLSSIFSEESRFENKILSPTDRIVYRRLDDLADVVNLELERRGDRCPYLCYGEYSVLSSTD